MDPALRAAKQLLRIHHKLCKGRADALMIGEPEVIIRGEIYQMCFGRAQATEAAFSFEGA